MLRCDEREDDGTPFSQKRNNNKNNEVTNTSNTLKTIDAPNFNTALKRLMFVSVAESFRSDKLALQNLRAFPVMSGAGYYLKRKPRRRESLHIPVHGSGPGLSPTVLCSGGIDIPCQPFAAFQQID